jgi:hypothetical protein
MRKIIRVNEMDGGKENIKLLLIFVHSSLEAGIYSLQ